jgi:hypothetical protein
MTRKLQTALIIILVSVFLSITGVWQYLTLYMPKLPQKETGNIIAVHVNYGKTVYINATLKQKLDTFKLACLLAFGVTVILICYPAVIAFRTGYSDAK